jgi:hypothetical protein
MSSWQQNFALGAIGALAPEVIRQLNIARQGQTFTWSWFLLVASLTYAAIAGVVAAILPSANLYAAFYSGISTDVLISRASRAAARTEQRKRNVVHKALTEPRSQSRLSALDSFLDAL